MSTSSWMPAAAVGLLLNALGCFVMLRKQGARVAPIIERVRRRGGFPGLLRAYLWTFPSMVFFGLHVLWIVVSGLAVNLCCVLMAFAGRELVNAWKHGVVPSRWLAAWKRHALRLYYSTHGPVGRNDR